MECYKIYNGKPYSGYCGKFKGIVEIRIIWIVENAEPPKVHKMTGFECPYGKELFVEKGECSVFQAAIFDE